MRFILAIIILICGVIASARTVELNSKNHVLISGNINAESIIRAAARLSILLNDRGSSDYKIYIVLDSPGGSIDPGVFFIDKFKNVPNIETLTLYAASMASAIVEALPGKRLCTHSPASYMFHEASNNYMRITITRTILQELVKDATKDFDDFDRLVYPRLKISKEVYEEKIKGKIWSLSCDEAIKTNVADEKVVISCSGIDECPLKSKIILETK